MEVDFNAVKTRQQAAWASGDYAVVGATLQIAAARRSFNFRYGSAAHFIDVFRTWYGPVHRAFAALAGDKAAALERDLAELLEGMNRAGPRSLVVPSEYLEAVVTLR